MAKRYRFTGNPTIAKYEPRGLDYFTYLPQLKAKVRGAAMDVANDVTFDTTGLYKADLEAAQGMTAGIETNRDNIVTDLVDGEAITDSLVSKISNLTKQKASTDEKLKVAGMNAKAIQEFNKKWTNYGVMKNNPLYAQKIKEHAATAFGSTFNEDGTLNRFEGYTPPPDIDTTKIIKDTFTLASRQMTPAQRGSLNAEDFKTIEINTGRKDPLTGKDIISYQLVHKNPKDVFTNNKGLQEALETVNTMFADPNSEAFQYLNFMGDEYTKGVMNEAAAMKDLYLLRDERASGMSMTSLGTSQTQATTTAKDKQGFVRDPLLKYQKSNIATVARKGVKVPDLPGTFKVDENKVSSYFQGNERYPMGEQKKPVIAYTPEDFKKYSTQAKSLSNVLFGETTTLGSLKYMKQGPTADEMREGVADPMEQNVLAKIIRQGTTAGKGEYGKTISADFNDAMDNLLNVLKEEGYEDTSEVQIPLSDYEYKQYLNGTSEIASAKIAVLEAASEAYNTVTLDAGAAENTAYRSRMLFNQPSFVERGFTGGKRVRHDIYKDIVLEDVIKNVNNNEILKYEIETDDGSKQGAQYKLVGTSADTKGDLGDLIRTEFNTILQNPDHLAPETFAPGYDFGEDLGKAGDDRYLTNKEFSQGFAYKSKIDGTMYVIPNKVGHLTGGGMKEQEKTVFVLSSDGMRRIDLETAVLGLEQGGSLDFTLPDDSLGAPQYHNVRVSHSGGSYVVTVMDENRVAIGSPTRAQTKSELMGVFQNFSQSPEFNSSLNRQR